MKYPALIINLKTYEQPLKEDFVKKAKKVSEDTGIDIILCPSHIFLKDASQKIKTFSQSMDPYELGAHSGSVLAEYIKAAGASGVLLNHSEKPQLREDLKKCIERTKSVGLLSCVCSPNEEALKEIVGMGVDIVLIEPPELVGGDVSVSKANPDIIKNSVKIAKKINPNVKVFCGAGIKTGEDVKIAVELGVDGVGVGSGIVKAADPEAAMRDIISGMSKKK